MKVSLSDLLQKIPGKPTVKWPQGDRYAEGFSHGSMLLGYYAPVGSDPQTPHTRDEIYIIQSGSSDVVIAGERQECVEGDAVFVAAGVEHRFENFSSDFGAWVIFWGPCGGEPANP